MQYGKSTYGPDYSNTTVDPVESGNANPNVWPQMMGMLPPPRVSMNDAYDLAMRTTVPIPSSRYSFHPEAQGQDTGQDHATTLMQLEQLEAARLKNREAAMRLDAASRPAPTKFVGPDYTSSGFAAHYTQDPSKMSAIQREMFLPNSAGVGHVDPGSGGYGPAPRGAMREAFNPSPRQEAAQMELDDAVAWSNFGKSNYTPSTIGGRIPTNRGPLAPSNRRVY